MEIGNMKNIVVLKNLPSNLIEEAIVVVKDNKKLQEYKYADTKNSKIEKEENTKRIIKKVSSKNASDTIVEPNKYIIKEAEMVINNYLSTLEVKSPKWKNNMKKLEGKYKKSVRINVVLAFITVLSIVFSLI